MSILVTVFWRFGNLPWVVSRIPYPLSLPLYLPLIAYLLPSFYWYRLSRNPFIIYSFYQLTLSINEPFNLLHGPTATK